ncbi:MAG: NAD(P)H-hydrate dehydratase [Rhodobacteraceae bacterium]|nr:NAD(P)H-hydrate dehydratase [Paracoccaceae bacterium]
MELLSAAQMRAIEDDAIESGAVTGFELMERAGAGVVTALLAQWPAFGEAPQKAVVLCGPGNNGGDGFVVARLLHGLGWQVEVFFFGVAERLGADARQNYALWGALGEINALTFPAPSAAEYAGAAAALHRAAVCIDALFGIGLTRPSEALSRLIQICGLNGAGPVAQRPCIVSIDIASGLSADSGMTLATDEYAAIIPDLTVTFEFAKIGHHLGFAAQTGKRLHICSIGLDHGRARQVLADSAAPGIVVGGRGMPEQIAPAVGPGLNKTSGQAHKFSHGHALVLAGGATKTGAARLAALGALRIGAGLVTLGAPEAALAECAAQLTAIMLVQADTAAALEQHLADPRITALCLGPALGVDREALVVVAIVSGRPLLLDADALTILARAPHIFGQLHVNCVLTPHAGEFARLFPGISQKLRVSTGEYSKVDATKAAAIEAGCTVLFKGADTVIADAAGRCAIVASTYDKAVPWLATAGSGDVLAGFITGLMARGYGPFDAAQAAAWLHGACGRSFGPGLIAEDLPAELPAVMRKLGF